MQCFIAAVKLSKVPAETEFKNRLINVSSIFQIFTLKTKVIFLTYTCHMEICHNTRSERNQQSTKSPIPNRAILQKLRTDKEFSE